MSVEMMMGSSLSTNNEIKDDDSRGKRKLAELRAAKIVVATAGAFEHALCKVSVLCHSPGVSFRSRSIFVLSSTAR